LSKKNHGSVIFGKNIVLFVKNGVFSQKNYVMAYRRKFMLHPPFIYDIIGTDIHIWDHIIFFTIP